MKKARRLLLVLVMVLILVSGMLMVTACQPGETANEWLTGKTVPQSTQGEDGDFYLDSAEWNVYHKVDGEWELVGSIKGEAGQPGTSGGSGNAWLTGTSVPTNAQGNDGDYYIKLNEWDVYHKESGSWVLKGSIKGVEGQPGRASEWLSGETAPTVEDGEDGDFYVNTKTWDVYQKEGGTWKPAGNIKGDSGKDGSTWYIESGEPDPDKGENGDFYLDIENDKWTVYHKEEGAWVNKGSIKGTPGVDTLVPEWHFGPGAPADNVGKEGDCYLDTTTGDIYQKTKDGWGEPKGTLGGKEDEPPVSSGSEWLSGKYDPDSSIGKNGDFYVNTLTGDLFVKENGEWRKIGNIGADVDPDVHAVKILANKEAVIPVSELGMEAGKNYEVSFALDKGTVKDGGLKIAFKNETAQAQDYAETVAINMYDPAKNEYSAVLTVRADDTDMVIYNCGDVLEATYSITEYTGMIKADYEEYVVPMRAGVPDATPEKLYDRPVVLAFDTDSVDADASGYDIMVQTRISDPAASAASMTVYTSNGVSWTSYSVDEWHNDNVGEYLVHNVILKGIKKIAFVTTATDRFENVTISFTKNFGVTIEDFDENAGKIEGVANGAYNENTRVSFTVENAKGYSIHSVKINGEEAEIKGTEKLDDFRNRNTYELLMNGNKTITVELTEVALVYDVTVVNGENGNYTLEGGDVVPEADNANLYKVPANTNMTLTLAPADGYKVKSLWIGGHEYLLNEENVYEFVPAAHITVKIEYVKIGEERKPENTKITVGANGYTEIDLSGRELEPGRNYRFIFVVENEFAGYDKFGVSFDGTEVTKAFDFESGIKETYTFNVVFRASGDATSRSGDATNKVWLFNMGGENVEGVYTIEEWTSQPIAADGKEYLTPIWDGDPSTGEGMSVESVLDIEDVDDGYYKVMVKTGANESADLTLWMFDGENWKSVTETATGDYSFDVQLNGCKWIALQTTTGSAIFGNSTVSIVKEYTVTIVNGEGTTLDGSEQGTVTPGDASMYFVKGGEKFAFSVAPSVGYAVKSVKAGETVLNKVSEAEGVISYEYVPEDDVIITVEYENVVGEYLKKHAGIYKSDDGMNRLVIGEDGSFVYNGESLGENLVIELVSIGQGTSESYQVRLYDKVVPFNFNSKFADKDRGEHACFEDPAAPIVLYKVPAFTLTFNNEDTKGTVTVIGGEAASYEKDKEVYFTISPNFGYAVKEVKVGEDVLTLNGGYYIVVMTKNTTVDITYEELVAKVLEIEPKTTDESSYKQYTMDELGLEEGLKYRIIFELDESCEFTADDFKDGRLRIVVYGDYANFANANGLGKNGLKFDEHFAYSVYNFYDPSDISAVFRAGNDTQYLYICNLSATKKFTGKFTITPQTEPVCADGRPITGLMANNSADKDSYGFTFDRNSLDPTVAEYTISITAVGPYTGTATKNLTFYWYDSAENAWKSKSTNSHKEYELDYQGDYIFDVFIYTYTCKMDYIELSTATKIALVNPQSTNPRYFLTTLAVCPTRTVNYTNKTGKEVKQNGATSGGTLTCTPNKVEGSLVGLAVTFTAKANKGYAIKSFTVDGVAIRPTRSEHNEYVRDDSIITDATYEYTISNPNPEIVIEFEETDIFYTIEVVNEDGRGTYTLAPESFMSGEYVVLDGTEVTLTVQPEEGLRIYYVTLGNNEVKLENNTYTFVPTDNVTLSIHYAQASDEAMGDGAVTLENLTKKGDLQRINYSNLKERYGIDIVPGEYYKVDIELTKGTPSPTGLMIYSMPESFAIPSTEITTDQNIWLYIYDAATQKYSGVFYRGSQDEVFLVINNSDEEIGGTITFTPWQGTFDFGAKGSFGVPVVGERVLAPHSQVPGLLGDYPIGMALDTSSLEDNAGYVIKFSINSQPVAHQIMFNLRDAQTYEYVTCFGYKDFSNTQDYVYLNNGDGKIGEAMNPMLGSELKKYDACYFIFNGMGKRRGLGGTANVEIVKIYGAADVSKETHADILWDESSEILGTGSMTVDDMTYNYLTFADRTYKFSLKPHYGYKVDTVKVNGVTVTPGSIDGKYSFVADGYKEIEITYVSVLNDLLANYEGTWVYRSGNELNNAYTELIVFVSYDKNNGQRKVYFNHKLCTLTSSSDRVFYFDEDNYMIFTEDEGVFGITVNANRSGEQVLTKVDTYDITLKHGNGGTYTVNGNGKLCGIKDGETKTLSFTALPGYMISKVIYGTNRLTETAPNSSTYTVTLYFLKSSTQETSNTCGYVEVEYKKVDCMINVQNGPFGTYELSENATNGLVPFGTEVTLKVKAEPRYKICYITIGGSVQRIPALNEEGEYVFTFKVNKEIFDIVIDYEIPKYMFSISTKVGTVSAPADAVTYHIVSVGDEGKEVNATVQKETVYVPNEAKVKWTMEINEKYQLVRVATSMGAKEDLTALFLDDFEGSGEYTTTVTSHLHFEVILMEKMSPVKLEMSADGLVQTKEKISDTSFKTNRSSIAFQNGETVYMLNDFEFAITPDLGYEIDKVTLNEQVLESTSSNDRQLVYKANLTTDGNVNVIKVTFKASEELKVTFNNVTNGKFTLTGDEGRKIEAPYAYNPYERLTLTLEPEEGYVAKVTMTTKQFEKAVTLPVVNNKVVIKPTVDAGISVNIEFTKPGDVFTETSGEVKIDASKDSVYGKQVIPFDLSKFVCTSSTNSFDQGKYYELTVTPADGTDPAAKTIAVAFGKKDTTKEINDINQIFDLYDSVAGNYHYLFWLRDNEEEMCLFNISDKEFNGTYKISEAKLPVLKVKKDEQITLPITYMSRSLASGYADHLDEAVERPMLFAVDLSELEEGVTLVKVNLTTGASRKPSVQCLMSGHKDAVNNWLNKSLDSSGNAWIDVDLLKDSNAFFFYTTTKGATGNATLKIVDTLKANVLSVMKSFPDAGDIKSIGGNGISIRTTNTKGRINSSTTYEWTKDDSYLRPNEYRNYSFFDSAVTDAKVELEIKANSGYCIDKVYLDEEDASSTLLKGGSNSWYFRINMTESHKLRVTYKVPDSKTADRELKIRGLEKEWFNIVNGTDGSEGNYKIYRLGVFGMKEFAKETDALGDIVFGCDNAGSNAANSEYVLIEVTPEAGWRVTKIGDYIPVEVNGKYYAVIQLSEVPNQPTKVDTAKTITYEEVE